MELKGLFTAMITPFDKNEQLDIAGLKQNINEQIQEGVDGLVFLGTTGESPTLTLDEKKQIIQTAVESVQKRTKVIIGTGTNCTRTTIELTALAKDMGADAALIVTPYYNKPTQEGIVRHFEKIAEATDFPLIAYNHPGRTSCFIEPRTIFKLATIPQVIGLKDATSDLSQVRRVIERLEGSFSVLSGCDPLTLSMMELGANGVISILSNLMPAKMKSMVDYALKGEFIEALKLHKELLPYMELMEIETNPIPIKAAMHLMNKPSGIPRLPLTELSARAFDQMKSSFEDTAIL